jgi:hypothetical protein
MDQGNPTWKTDRRGRVGEPKILEGDIVVTAVAERYAIGKMTVNGDTQESLGSQQKLAEALEQACGLAAAKHRVFLFPNPDRRDYVRFVCPKVAT